jgi:spermidine synthase
VGKWTLLDEAEVPGSPHPLTLYRNVDEFVIRVGHIVLMTSRIHGSEDALADEACRRLKGRTAPRVLIGGLGMGFTLAAALRGLGPDSEVVVADVVPEVVEWNRGELGEAAGRPLDDSRTTVYVGDVAAIMREQPASFDAILIDIDNGPDGLSRMGNERLYGNQGLAEARVALRKRGILGVWSVAAEAAFTRRM